MENKSNNDWAIFRINSGKKWFVTSLNSTMKSPDEYQVIKYSANEVLKFNHNEAIKIIQSAIGMQEKYGIVNSKGNQKVFDWRVKYPAKYDDVNNLIKEDVIQEGITAKGVAAYYKAVAKSEGVTPLTVKFGRVGKGGAALTYNGRTMKPLHITFDMNRMSDPEYAVLHELTHQIKLETENDAYQGKRDQLAKFKKLENKLVEKYMYSKYSELIWKTDSKNEGVIDMAAYKLFEVKGGVRLSEGLEWHIQRNIPLAENIFRYGSSAYIELYREARDLVKQSLLEVLDEGDRWFMETDLGKVGIYEGKQVLLDFPIPIKENKLELQHLKLLNKAMKMMPNSPAQKKVIAQLNLVRKELGMKPLNEAEYKGRDVQLNKPQRSSGPKKYQVYVKNDKGNVIKVNFGDVKGGLTAKINDPEARKAFADRHDCKNKKDKTSAGWWSCNLPRYGKALGLTSGNFYW